MTAKDDLVERLHPKLVQIRSRRIPIEAEWLNNHAAWKATRTRAFYISEGYQYYIPMARRAIERYTVRVTQMLLPSVNAFEVLPGDEIDLAAGQQADAVRAYMHWLTEQRIQLRRNISQWSRCLLLYTRAIGKNTIQIIDTPVEVGTYKGHLKQIWPTSRVVDPFSFYVWPETAANTDDAQILFEDCMMPYGEYQQAVEQELADAIPQDDLTAPEWPYHLTQRLGLSGMTAPTDVPAVTAGISEGKTIDSDERKPKPPPTAQAFVALSEVWFKAKNRWVMAWIVNNCVGGPKCTRLNPAQYPESPYRWAVARPLPNEHYTNALMSDLEPLQILLNDQFNQTEEARAIAALPPVIIDVNAVTRTDTLVYGPRKKWLMENVTAQAARPLEITDGPSMSGLRAIQQTMALMNSVGAQSPAMDGQTVRNSPRGSSAFNNMLQMGLADVQDVAQILETELLTPTLGDLYRLTLAFVPPAQIIQITGSQEYKPQTLTVDALMGSWQFRWVGSLQAQNQQVKNQQLMVMAQLLMKGAPALEGQGWAVNWGILGKRLWREGLGERGVEQIIIPVTELATVNPAGALLLQARQAQQAAAAAGGPAMNGGPPGGAGTPPAGPEQMADQLSRGQNDQGLTQALAGLSQ